MLGYDKFCTKTDTGDIIKVFWKIQRQQENTEENTKKTTGNKLGLIKKDFLINTSEDMWNDVAPY